MFFSVFGLDGLLPLLQLNNCWLELEGILLIEKRNWRGNIYQKNGRFICNYFSFNDMISEIQMKPYNWSTSTRYLYPEKSHGYSRIYPKKKLNKTL